MIKHNRNRIASLLAAASLLALAPSHAAAPGAVALKYRFKTGQVLHYQYATDVTGTTDAAGVAIPTTTRMTADYTQTVQSVDPATGNATIKVAFGQSKMTMTMNGKSMPMNMPTSVLGDTTIVMSPSGKPVSFKMDGAAGASALGTSMSGLFSGGNSGMSQYSAFPPHPVSVGDVWRSAVSVGSVAGGTLYAKQSLVGLSSAGGHSMADIASRYSMNMNMSPAAMGRAMHITGTETGTGREQFDITDGSIKSMAMTMHINTLTRMPSGMTAAVGTGTGRNTGAVSTRMVMTMHMQRVP